jgi:hypothetical protein
VERVGPISYAEVLRLLLRVLSRFLPRLMLRLLGKMCRVYGYWQVNGAPHPSDAVLERS